MLGLLLISGRSKSKVRFSLVAETSAGLLARLILFTCLPPFRRDESRRQRFLFCRFPVWFLLSTGYKYCKDIEKNNVFERDFSLKVTKGVCIYNEYLREFRFQKKAIKICTTVITKNNFKLNNNKLKPFNC